MNLKTRLVLPLAITLSGLVLIQQFALSVSFAQYYPSPTGYDPTSSGGGYPPPTGYVPYNAGGGYPAPTGYDPNAAMGGYSAPPGYGGYGSPPAGYTYPQQGYPAPIGYGVPPSAGYYGAPPSAGVPASPYATGEAPSFGGYPAGTPPTTTTAPPSGYGMAGYAPSVSTIAGFKYSYFPDAGDYVSAQSRGSARWEQFPITLHMTYPEGMAESDKEAIKAAVAAWQKHVDITLINQPDLAKIELNWVSELSEDDELGDTQFTATHPDGMGRIIADKAVIRMLDPSRYAGVTSGALKSAMMHQLGHALGINTHSDNSRDLMSTPFYKRERPQIVQKAMRSLASKTIGQFLGISTYQDTTPIRKIVGPPVDKVGKRDLNTLFRFYNGAS